MINSNNMPVAVGRRCSLALACCRRLSHQVCILCGYKINMVLQLQHVKQAGVIRMKPVSFLFGCMVDFIKVEGTDWLSEDIRFIAVSHNDSLHSLVPEV